MNRLFQAIEALLALLLAAMVVMVFGNVVLRYAFNSGIVVSEELSRVFFVWVTFIGAVVAMRDGSHLGMDTLVRALSRRGRIVCCVLSQSLILICCAMLLRGTWLQHEVNASTLAPVTEIPMIWVYGVVYLSATGIGLHALVKLWRAVTGRILDSELLETSESEELPQVHIAERADR
ncbi:ABC transporter permease [Sinorhizobium fredii USDA 205]|uniref:TRAP transporter small permease protein n=1 Tax=Rhizobium fredii TaxID=380 RepID=A0A844A9F6_RHIFR|nr:TRAP transporter small permease [Sinorhizobium fredii]ASY71930.1 TRAP-type C4-dicarboxylate transport system, small permease component [Sinorhizobium fredii CCBAU 83666]AWM28030.1 TRAP-type C4-dicarboxylate transport system small permease component [Sinorhizobium fredii CCBAU 25509]KSV82261.1 ABC transporter permease [Sinorhizobium fredii USDA 205]MCG5476720.1 TRAP transporter small permease [Sinorhizobium fredii]MQX08702.1 TRAP transporter small permease subunit [Sinorhizobium fredii]